MLTINNCENMRIMRPKNVNRYKNVSYAALEWRKCGTGEEADHWEHGEDTWKKILSWMGRPGINSNCSPKTVLTGRELLASNAPVGQRRV